MQTLSELGLDDTVRRAAVVHVDDLGMSWAANEGGFEALATGPATCGSVMVPCPWFPDAAARARADRSVDLGVHLTLNAEYPAYRWGPVLGAAAVPTLVDGDGYLPLSTDAVVANADLDEVDRELRAQVDRALDAGIDVTHLDSHMGTMFHTGFIDVYVQLARDYEVPLFIMRGAGAERIAGLEADGFPVFDGFCADSLGFAPGTGAQHNQRRIADLTPGLNYLICHAARAGTELTAITPHDAHARDFERSYYGGADGRAALEAEGVAVVGMRALRDLLRSNA